MSALTKSEVENRQPNEEDGCEPNTVVKMKDMLNGCSTIKYAAYRMAAKLHCLQRVLQMNHVRLGLIAGVFYRHQLQASENEVLLDSDDLEAVVSDIFFAAEKETLHKIDVDLVTENMVQLLLNIYDGKANGALQVISAKVALVVLSSARLQEKYQYFFHQLADHNNCISRKKIELLLTNLSKIAEYVSESLSFGPSLVPSTVESCIQQSQGTLGITEDGFIGWLFHEPQLLVWMSTFYRMQAAEMVHHSVKCAVCKVYPIQGLRYKCLRCLKYNQCQTCFFTGKLSKRHKLKHPMQEYCSETTAREATIAFLRTLRNKLWKYSSKHLQYLPAQPNASDEENGYSKETVSTVSTSGINSRDRDHLLDEMDLSTRTILNGSRVALQPYKELQSIIHNLEDENRQLQEEIEQLCSSGGGGKVEACLKDHRLQVEAQVERLKLLKHYLLQIQVPAQAIPICHTASTPIAPVAFRFRNGGLSVADLDSISPITKDEDCPSNGLKRLRFISHHHERSKTVADVHTKPTNSNVTTLPSLSERSIGDLSTWLCKGDPKESVESSNGITMWLPKLEKTKPTLEELHGDLDDIIEKLQNMLATNFSVEDSFNGKDNVQLQKTATEIEDLVAGLIEGIEHRKRMSNGHSTDGQTAS